MLAATACMPHCRGAVLAQRLLLLAAGPSAGELPEAVWASKESQLSKKKNRKDIKRKQTKKKQHEKVRGRTGEGMM